jgi:hypothetical protein
MMCWVKQSNRKEGEMEDRRGQRGRRGRRGRYGSREGVEEGKISRQSVYGSKERIGRQSLICRHCTLSSCSLEELPLANVAST